MTSKPVALPLADLGVTQSHSRPHVSNDNPYSEAQFKTLKYRPGFPARFGSIEAARAHCRDFFPWYNNEHRHGGLGLHAAGDVHHGRAAAVQEPRAGVLTTAYQNHPSASSASHLPRRNYRGPPGSTRPKRKKPTSSNKHRPVPHSGRQIPASRICSVPESIGTRSLAASAQMASPGR